MVMLIYKLILFDVHEQTGLILLQNFCCNFCRYFPPIQSSSGERTIDQLRTVAEIEHEIMKQESLLGSLHAQIAAGKVSRRKEERLWEAQRIVTLLKVSE